MSLRTAFPAHPAALPRLPPLSKTAAFAGGVGGSGGNLVEPPEGLDEVAERFMSDFRAGAEPSRRDWRNIPWCIWATRPALADDVRCLEFALDRISVTGRPRHIRTLATAYLSQFAVDRPHLARIASVVRSGASIGGNAWQRLADCGAFDGAQGPARFADIALNAMLGPDKMLASMGFEGALLSTRFVEAVHHAGLAAIRNRPLAAALEHMARIEAWSFRDGDFAFPHARVDVGNTLVLPLGSRSLGPKERLTLSRFMLHHFDDPRTKRARWIGMDAAAEIVRRWLVEQSLRQFLDVVGEVAKLEQWTYRRAFWMAAYERDLIRDAYVAFDPLGAQVAERRFKEDAPFGRLSGSGGSVQTGQAVLVMLIGNAVVADWSHDGRCNIWERADEPGAPRLHEPSYIRSNLRKDIPNDWTEDRLNRRGVYRHTGAPGYLWQRRVADHLFRLTGIRLSPDDYEAD